MASLESERGGAVGARGTSRHRIPNRLARLALAVCALAGAAPAQELSPPVDLAELKRTFAEWQARGERKEIAWNVRLEPPRLNLDQRLEAHAVVEVKSKTLNRTGDRHDLLLALRIGDAAGQWYEGIAYYQHATEGKLANLKLIFRLPLLVRPGEYTVGVMLHDRDTQRGSFTTRRLRVRPLSGDPLPDAWRDLPAAEFGRFGMGPGRYITRTPPKRMWLPVESERPVHIEVLVNLSPSERMATRWTLVYGRRGWTLMPDRRAMERWHMGTMLSLLNVFSQVHLPRGGTLNVTALDITRQRVVFRQEGVERMDWPRFRAAVAEVDPNTIDLSELANRHKNPSFFRDVFAERLGRLCAAGGARGARRVVVVLSGGMLFDRGADLRPLEPPPGCTAQVYHLVAAMTAEHTWDELHRLISTVKPQRIPLENPAQARRVLARLLKEFGS